nr:zinc finger C2H2 type [Hymenolepis microstoma]
MSLNKNISPQPLNQSVSTGLHVPLAANSQLNSLNSNYVPHQPTFLPVASTSVNIPMHQSSSISSLQSAPIALPSQPTNVSENGRPLPYSSTAAYYKEYYVNVMNFLKSRIDAVESSNSSKSNQFHTAPSNGIPSGLPQDNDPWSHAEAVMKGYFHQRGSREFDWASWNNYLSWISRLHPTWYECFCECSRNLGIDWNVMYKKFLESKSLADDQTPAFDLSKPPPTTTSDPQQAPPPPITNPFPLTSIPPPKDSRVWCEDCDLYLPDQRAYDIHLRAVVHIQNALTKTITQNVSAVLDIPPPQITQTKNPLLPLEPLSLPQNRSFVDISRPSPKVRLRLQHLLDICIQPLIGLNYVIEFQRRNLLDCIYVCDLCEKRAFLPSAVIQHVCSRKHRMTYLKYHYPPLFHLIKLDKSCALVKKRRLASYAQQIESSEGRKRLSIMMEKENSSFKTREGAPRTKLRRLKHSLTPVQEKDEKNDDREKPSDPLVTSGILTAESKVEILEKEEEARPSATPSSPTVDSKITDKILSDRAENEDIEEGEMLDCSSTSSYVDAVDDDGSQGNEDSDTVPPTKQNDQPETGTRCGRGVIFSPSQSSDEDEEENSHELPSFFTSGVESQPGDVTPSIQVYLPDFEVGFVSERPQLPAISVEEKEPKYDEVSSEFINEIANEGLLNVQREESSKPQESSSEAKLPPTDSQLAESFQHEVQWALKCVEKAQRKTNHLQFHFNCQPKSSASSPLLPNPPKLATKTTTRNDVSSINLSASTNGESASDIVTRAVRVLLGEFKPPLLSPPKSTQTQPTLTTAAKTPSRTLLHQPPFLPTLPAMMTTSKVEDTSKPGNDSESPPPKHPKVDKLDGVKSLLATPIDALNALLSGGSSTSNQLERDNQQKQPQQSPIIYTTQTSSSNATTTPAPTEIFDGYSFFNRQVEEEQKIKTQEQEVTGKQQERGPEGDSTSITNKVKKPPLLSHRPRAGTATTTTATPTRSRLAAFADMYGMNERSFPQPPSTPQQAVQQQQNYTTQSVLPPQLRPAPTISVNPTAAIQQAAAIQASQNAWLAAATASLWQQQQQPQVPLLSTPGTPLAAANPSLALNPAAAPAFGGGTLHPNTFMMPPNYFGGGPILRPPQWGP